jgi:hypothetical protein
MRKAIYIGAGHDIVPFLTLSYIDHFVCIDSAPTHNCGLVIYDNYKVEKYSWIKTLLNKMQNIGFRYIPKVYPSVPSLCFEHVKTKQTVHYFIDVIFPYTMHYTAQEEILGADTLIVIGHMPNKKVLKYLADTFEVVGATGTYYGEDELSEDELNLYLIKHRVNKWTYIKKPDGGYKGDLVDVVSPAEMNMRSTNDVCSH